MPTHTDRQALEDQSILPTAALIAPLAWLSRSQRSAELSSMSFECGGRGREICYKSSLSRIQVSGSEEGVVVVDGEESICSICISVERSGISNEGV